MAQLSIADLEEMGQKSTFPFIQSSFSTKSSNSQNSMKTVNSSKLRSIQNPHVLQP